MSIVTELFEGLDEVDKKVCNQCKKMLPITDFGFNSEALHRRAKCRACERHTTDQKKKYKYLKPPQDHSCPICLRSEEECAGRGGKKVGTWCLDHNHQTGEMRGWLCHDCNRALGNFKDNVTLLERAIKYLTGEMNDIPSNR